MSAASESFRWHVLSECPDEGPCPIHGRQPDPDARWHALKDYLAEHIAADESVRQGMVADGETELAAPFGGLVSANRSTLAKMRELEAGK
jgi:hypothetical protein